MRLGMCPSCGSRRIKNVQRDWVGESNGRTYIVHRLRFSECPDWGERVYGLDVIRRIEAASPAFSRGHGPTLVHASM
jgi:hypothetical protein